MIILWIAVAVGMIVLEAATVQLVSIWFALGAICALICEICGLDIVWQCIVFTVVSLVALVATRSMVKKFTHNKKVPTNADRLIGQKAIVIDEIDNDSESGSAKLNGLVWTARSADGTVIESGKHVKVLKIDGVRLIVEPFSENNI